MKPAFDEFEDDDHGARMAMAAAFLVCIVLMITIPAFGSYVSHHGPEWTRESAEFRILASSEVVSLPANKLNIGVVMSLIFAWLACAAFAIVILTAWPSDDESD